MGGVDSTFKYDLDQKAKFRYIMHNLIRRGGGHGSAFEVRGVSKSVQE